MTKKELKKRIKALKLTSEKVLSMIEYDLIGIYEDDKGMAEALLIRLETQIINILQGLTEEDIMEVN